MTLIVAHRGYWKEHPQNSISSFEAAIAAGADMIELDVRATRDGALLVVHDPEHRGMAIADSVSSAIRHGDYPPTLHEALDVVAGRIELDVEVKTTGYEEAVVAALCERIDVRDFVVTSFDPRVLQRVREYRSAVTTGLLVAAGEPADVLTDASDAGAWFLAPAFELIDEELLATAAARGFPLTAWTVNDPAMIERLVSLPEVTRLITDEVEWALEIRNSRPPA